MLLENDVIVGYALLELGVASCLGLGSCEERRWGCWSRARFGGLYSVARDQVPGWVSIQFRGQQSGHGTFFCSLTTLVHFFSMTPSYFFRLASSKSSGRGTSSRNASTVFEAPIAPRYAIIALFLTASCQCPARSLKVILHSQLLGLAIRQYCVHGGAIGRSGGIAASGDHTLQRRDR